MDIISSFDDEFTIKILEMLPKERIYRNRYDPLVEYDDDSDFFRRFR